MTFFNFIDRFDSQEEKYYYDESSESLILDVPGFFKDEISIDLEDEIYLKIKCKSDRKTKDFTFIVRKNIDNVKLINGQLVIKFKDNKKQINIM
jgi:HSP20 family molecular chaperone IbpA